MISPKWLLFILIFFALCVDKPFILVTDLLFLYLLGLYGVLQIYSTQSCQSNTLAVPLHYISCLESQQSFVFTLGVSDLTA